MIINKMSKRPEDEFVYSTDANEARNATIKKSEARKRMRERAKKNKEKMEQNEEKK